MGTGHVEFPVDIGLHQGNDPLVLGQLDFEVVIHSGYDAQLPFQLSVHIYPVAWFQIKLVVVVGETLVPAGKADLNNGLPRCGCCWERFGRGRGWLCGFLRADKTIDREFHRIASSTVLWCSFFVWLYSTKSNIQ